jgi:sigma-B regulation protein RsbU (phosphoserine phosphatase)
MQVARTIQSSMYAVDKKAIPGYESAWTTRTCDETGGDYLDLISLPEPRTAFAVGDVSGHGIGAALLMATGRASLRALLSVKDESPREVLNCLNVLLGHDLLDMEMFMTMFVSFLDYERHELSYVNAGHDRPLFYRADAGVVTQLGSSGIPLGLSARGKSPIATSSRSGRPVSRRCSRSITTGPPRRS